MDNTEKLVHEYLIHLGFRDIVYEPDGNVPPDFLIDGRIGVEVRRLNQNENISNKPRGLEETSKPLEQVVNDVLASMGPPINNTSWFVSYTFSRPILPWKDFKQALTACLVAFMNKDLSAPPQLNVSERFTVEFIRASQMHPTLFVPAGYDDLDAGGFVLAEILQNLNLCSNEKLQKVAKVRRRYPEWWLALVDHIGYGLDENSRSKLRELVQRDAPWDKIIFVNPLNPTRGFEL